MSLNLVITNAGRAAMVNAANTGTNAVTIASVGVSPTAIVAAPTTTTLPGEVKRIATIGGDGVADDVIHLLVLDETGATYTVRSVALYLGDGTLFASYGQPGVIVEKSAGAAMMLALDVKLEDVSAATIAFGDTDFVNPPASTDRAGVVELATLAEVQAGADNQRALTSWSVRQTYAALSGATFTGGVVAPYFHAVGAGVGSIAMLPGNAGKVGFVSFRDSANGEQARIGDSTVGTPLLFQSAQGFVFNGGWVHAGVAFGAPQVQAREGTTTGGIRMVTGYAASTGYISFDDAAGEQIAFLGANSFASPILFAATYGVDFRHGPVTHTGNIFWHAGNDGSGSGSDADLLDGQHGSYYADVIARLGYTPVTQGEGAGQSTNRVFIGWSGSGLKAQVDATDLGTFVFANQIADVWRASNDGAGSGMDADMVDGWHAADLRAWSNITGAPATFPPSSHGHDWNEITGKPATYPATGHNHPASAIDFGVTGENTLNIGGVVIKWGTVEIYSTPGWNNFSFPTAFPNSCQAVIITPRNATGGRYRDSYFQLVSKTAAGFAYLHQEPNETDDLTLDGFDWVAIGR